MLYFLVQLSALSVLVVNFPVAIIGMIDRQKLR